LLPGIHLSSSATLDIVVTKDPVEEHLVRMKLLHGYRMAGLNSAHARIGKISSPFGAQQNCFGAEQNCRMVIPFRCCKRSGLLACLRPGVEPLKI
jgi:hypothetical protein